MSELNINTNTTDNSTRETLENAIFQMISKRADCRGYTLYLPAATTDISSDMIEFRIGENQFEADENEWAICNMQVLRDKYDVSISEADDDFDAEDFDAMEFFFLVQDYLQEALAEYYL